MENVNAIYEADEVVEINLGIKPNDREAAPEPISDLYVYPPRSGIIVPGAIANAAYNGAPFTLDFYETGEAEGEGTRGVICDIGRGDRRKTVTAPFRHHTARPESQASETFLERKLVLLGLALLDRELGSSWHKPGSELSTYQTLIAWNRGT